MSKVCGARYSAVTPSSAAAAFTPLATTDQNGSDAWPCVTTAIRNPFWLTAPLVWPVVAPFVPPLPHAAATSARSATATHTRFLIHPPPVPGTAHSAPSALPRPPRPGCP